MSTLGVNQFDLARQPTIPCMLRPILIVEDQKSAAELLKNAILATWNVDVHIARSYSEAKEFLKQHRQDYLLAICDLNLPDASKGEILQLVDKAEVRSVAMTGAYQRRTREQLQKKHLVDYVLKGSPNSQAYLVGLVGRLYKNQFIKVLVVDDSPSALALLEELVSLLNFDVYTATDGAEAFEQLQRIPDIRLVITDYEMPNMDGFALTLQARNILNKEQLAIIGLSASDNTDLGSMFIKNGANDFLCKPYSFEELFCRINMNVEALEHLDYINELASTDSLTNLANRRSFFANGHNLFREVSDPNQSLFVAILDIDHFKVINDKHGHDAGDKVLKSFAFTLSEHFPTHLVARVGGEEFAILFTSGNEESINVALENFKNSIAQKEVNVEKLAINMTVSIGLANGKDNSLDAALKHADLALYEAKKTGRNKVVMSTKNG